MLVNFINQNIYTHNYKCYFARKNNLENVKNAAALLPTYIYNKQRALHTQEFINRKKIHPNFTLSPAPI